MIRSRSWKMLCFGLKNDPFTHFGYIYNLPLKTGSVTFYWTLTSSKNPILRKRCYRRRDGRPDRQSWIHSTSRQRRRSKIEKKWANPRFSFVYLGSNYHLRHLQIVTDLSISRKHYHLLKIFTKAFFSKKIQML